MLVERERYLWVDDELDLSWTVAVIDGATEQTAVAAYSGGRRSEFVGRREFAQAYVSEDDLGEYFLIQVIPQGRRIVVLENNGWLGTNREVAQRASSARGRFFSVYWSPSGDRIVQAADGEILAWFDPLSAGGTCGGGDIYPGWLRDVVFSTDGLHSTMLAVLEWQTGQGFSRRWLHEELPTYRIFGR